MLPRGLSKWSREHFQIAAWCWAATETTPTLLCSEHFLDCWNDFSSNLEACRFTHQHLVNHFVKREYERLFYILKSQWDLQQKIIYLCNIGCSNPETKKGISSVRADGLFFVPLAHMAGDGSNINNFHDIISGSHGVVSADVFFTVTSMHIILGPIACFQKIRSHKVAIHYSHSLSNEWKLFLDILID